MDVDNRIAELEHQVHLLTEEVRRLRSSREKAPPESSVVIHPAKYVLSAPSALGATRLLEDVRKGVGKALGGDDDESIEERIGGIWLIRVAVVLLMTGLALGATEIIDSARLLPWHKVLIGYAASVIAITYGIAYGRRQNLFAETLLGAGFAGIYFSTYASFFVERTLIFRDQTIAQPLLLIVLTGIMCVIHWRKSQTTAGITLFLVYYTIVVSCTTEKSAASLTYALITCAIVCLVALAFHAYHRWMMFTWGAFVATYITYIFYFWAKPPEIELSDKSYFWLSNGFLALCYSLFSIMCVIDARRRGEFRRTVAPLAGVNSAVFFTLTWFSIRAHFFEQEWAFRLGFAVALALLALFAETAGPTKNYLFQIFIAKAVVMFTLMLQSLLSGELLLLAMAIECIGLVLSYRRSGIVAFKIINMALMTVTTLGCLFSARMGGYVDVGPYSIRSNWLCCAGVPVVFLIVAWMYEKFVQQVRPEFRTVSGQWFLADTRLDVASATAAMLHAAAAALILLTVTILDQGENPTLPYMLAGEAVLMGLVGLVLRTPQIDVAGVLLLVASHVSYYFFLWIDKPGFETQFAYHIYTILVALATFVGAYLWERYLYRIATGSQWEHDSVASVPYLIATILLTTLCFRSLGWMYGPLAQNALATSLLLTGCLTHYTGLKASGIVAFAIGMTTFFSRLYSNAETPALAQEAHFISYLVIFTLSFCAGERLLATLQRQERIPTHVENHLRSLLVVAGAASGLLGLYAWSDQQRVTILWGLLALGGMCVGALFRESRYRWISLVIFGMAIVRAYWNAETGLALVYQFLILGLVGLVVSWAYSRFRSRRARLNEDPPVPRVSQDG